MLNQMPTLIARPGHNGAVSLWQFQRNLAGSYNQIFVANVLPNAIIDGCYEASDGWQLVKYQVKFSEAA